MVLTPPECDRCHGVQASLIAELSSEALEGIVREDWSQAPLLSRVVPSLRPKLRSAELRTQRDRILALARVPMDRSVLHERILMSVHRTVTKEETLPKRFGPHWESIGFQGGDPATDLRGAGMLALVQASAHAAARARAAHAAAIATAAGLLTCPAAPPPAPLRPRPSRLRPQVLHMASKRPQLLRSLFALSRNGSAFPLLVVSINMTQIVTGALRAGALTREANRTRSVYDVCHTFHAACCLHMHDEWKRRGLSIQDFGHLKKELERAARTQPAKLLRAVKAYDASPKIPGLATTKGDNFVSFG